MSVNDLLLEAIDIRIKEYVSNLKFDKTVIGVVKSINANGSYQVEINGAETSIMSIDGLALNVNDVVCVKLIQGNFSQKYIECKRPF